MKNIFYSIFIETICFIILFVLLVIFSGIFGLVSRTLKILIKREARKIDKAFFGLFTIIAIIIVILFDIGVFLKAFLIVSNDRSVFFRVLQYFIYQIGLSFLLGVMAELLKCITTVFIYCSNGSGEEILDENTVLCTLGIPIFILNLSHALPALAIIVYIFKLIF